MADQNATAPFDRNECLRLLDHVESLMRWCSVNDVPRARFTNGEAAMWAVAHRLAGRDDDAGRLIAEYHLLDVAPL